jgi:hypothetical protein
MKRYRVYLSTMILSPWLSLYFISYSV